MEWTNKAFFLAIIQYLRSHFDRSVCAEIKAGVYQSWVNRPVGEGWQPHVQSPEPAAAGVVALGLHWPGS